VAPPFKEAEFDLIYGEGISSLGEIIDLGTEHDILQKRGSWYSYQDETIAQGRENTKEWLQDNPEQREEIKSALRGEIGLSTVEEESEGDDEGEDEEPEAAAEEA